MLTSSLGGGGDKPFHVNSRESNQSLFLLNNSFLLEAFLMKHKFLEPHVHYFYCYWALFSLDDLFFLIKGFLASGGF